MRRTQYAMRGEPPPPKRKTSAEFTGLIDKRTLEAPLPADPRLVPPYDVQDIAAANAMRNGEATPEQQRRFLEWVIHYACGTYQDGLSFDPIEMAIWGGRRKAGASIVKLIWTKTPTQSNSEQG